MEGDWLGSAPVKLGEQFKTLDVGPQKPPSGTRGVPLGDLGVPKEYIALFNMLKDDRVVPALQKLLETAKTVDYNKLFEDLAVTPAVEKWRLYTSVDLVEKCKSADISIFPEENLLNQGTTLHGSKTLEKYNGPLGWNSLLWAIENYRTATTDVANRAGIVVVIAVTLTESIKRYGKTDANTLAFKAREFNNALWPLHAALTYPWPKNKSYGDTVKAIKGE